MSMHSITWGEEQHNNSNILSRNGLEAFFVNAQHIKKGPCFSRLIEKTGPIGYVMITGSSGAGKTTQVTNINSFNKNNENHFSLATRYITRKGRASDNTTGFHENILIESKEVFMKMVANGDIDIRWERELGSENALYGFESQSSLQTKYPQGVGIIIYSGNNDMARNFTSMSFCNEHKDEFLHIHVEADDNINRFIQRSGDIVASDKVQVEKRASDNGQDVCAMAHIVIDNTHGAQQSIKTELEMLMDILKQHNSSLAKNKQDIAEQIIDTMKKQTD